MSISIHKALAGLDHITLHQFRIQSGFQSTRPSRASTGLKSLYLLNISISIHKALAGLDRLVNHNNISFDISIHKALAGLDSLSVF